MSGVEAIHPLSGLIRVAADGSYFLEGSRCTACGEVLVSAHRACPKCADDKGLEKQRLGERGRLYTYTIVHRSFPGVATPIISAVVELDGGGFLKGNLIDMPPDPKAIAFDMPVRVSFELMPPAATGDPQRLRYVFVPDREAHHD